MCAYPVWLDLGLVLRRFVYREPHHLPCSRTFAIPNALHSAPGKLLGDNYGTNALVPGGQGALAAGGSPLLARRSFILNWKSYRTYRATLNLPGVLRLHFATSQFAGLYLPLVSNHEEEPKADKSQIY